MNESIIISDKAREQISARTGLVGLGIKVRQLGILAPIEEEVKIGQKTVKYTPYEKLTDGLIAILSGAKGLVEINKRVRSDPALQAAFGRDGCAEQSVVQDTLDACTGSNVKQMQAAVDRILRAQSQVCRHDYCKDWLIIEVDMTGRPCGRKAEFASKGYFAKQRNRRGRQEGYVVASQYGEIVVKRIYDGTTQLNTALQPLMQAAQEALELTAEQRARTILRVDSGGGSVEDVNWALEQGYQIHGKDYSGRRAEHLAESVTEWVTDPRDADRQMGWVTETTDIYKRPIKRIAVRCRKNNGQWAVGVILSTLSARDVLLLTGQALEKEADPQAVLLAYVHFYDQRGGGVEIEIKEDKQGFQMSKRNKKRFAAQQMVCQLEAIAHNLLVWARQWLAPLYPKIASFGMLRLVRDVLHITGKIWIGEHKNILKIVLNPADPFARQVQAGLAALLAPEQVAVCLGET
jgi:hypothetical protein